MEYLIDFKSLDFHDSPFYAFGTIPLNYQLLMDIDWIIARDINLEKSKIEISPATLVFENVWNLSIDIDMNNELIIDSIDILSVGIPRNKDCFPTGTKEYDWHIEFINGTMEFKSIGFSIYQRKVPQIKGCTQLTMFERGGISLKKRGNRYKVSVLDF